MNCPQTSARGLLDGLLPMSYLSIVFMALAIVAVAVVRLDGAAVGLALGLAAVLLLLALGVYLGVRWTMVTAMVLGLVVWSVALTTLVTGSVRPPFVHLLLPPLMVGFNYLALRCPRTTSC